MDIKRCTWCSNDPLYIAYHDEEWGRPCHNESKLFEMLCLEGQQAGLSWITVLKKREHYRKHFFQYSIAHIAQFTETDLTEKLQDAGLIRHRGKLKSIRDNAIAWQRLSHTQDMVHFLWDFIGHKPQVLNIEHYTDAPTQSLASQQMSKTLKKHGFKFVGPTICYAFMQAVGMLNDHENDCFVKYHY